MKYSTIPSAQTVAHYCKIYGIKEIVISPGSRNAPLTITFTEDDYFNCFSVVDERCAAFFALGMAQQQQKPVAVICTSGSALLNYYPAISEAFYSDIPLVVISADRPPYKIDIGDGQTIRQDHVFDRHIGYSANLKLDVSHATETIKKQGKSLLSSSTSLENQQAQIEAYNDKELGQAFQLAIETMSPVHINVPFEEPLYNTTTVPNHQPALVYKKPELDTVEDLTAFATSWNQAKRKLVLVGVAYPNAVAQEYLDFLATDKSVIVLTETTSNLHHPNFFTSIDSLIAPIEKSVNSDELFKKLQPDIVLTFGGLIVSKKIKSFLRTYKAGVHWHIDAKKAYDTFFSITHHFETSENTFFRSFIPKLKAIESDYYSYWSAVKRNYEVKRNQYLKEIPFSDMLAFSKIAKSIPKNYQLHLANSSTVRYAQLFAIDPSITVFCNRGTSGIDGSTSTAVGAAIYHQEPTLLITGDISFLYDSNGLWNKNIRSDFRVIILNNDGGGIFRILPGQEDTANFETFFETTHAIDIAKLCSGYNILHEMVDNEKNLEKALINFYKGSKIPKLLEIKTPRLINNKILLSYFDFIS
ncbi:2-succinyl-5-enolpyruvyl-6-hydroxy-3-cyclohexene-1-carboxylic-acid synthase [Cellulophaga sp. Z1A5H]|uniref:2-succinyl-5-enolpyruvyl-6-hydroxy-3- cyclohexene-1-carboxylic-acid synthase n=1 Tax=Cellulophaga sp. Z1A5H TaxID=2687291 RepID=UPI0013FD17F1|nr:2-succinyl-5-enolpyruvyl-6-hydroxy-3-cyclohexene-1-carboxylic-acid synthase [Cellulophaga sp. Z1A5H]